MFRLPWWLRWQSILLQCTRPGFDAWVRKIPWRWEQLPTPVFLAWRISWTEELGGLQSTGLQRVRHDWVTNTHINNVHFNQYWVIWGQNEICTTGEMVCFYFLNLAKFCLGDGCMGSFQLPELTLLESISRSASNHSLPSLWPEYFQFWLRMVLPAAKQNEPPTLWELCVS